MVRFRTAGFFVLVSLVLSCARLTPPAAADTAIEARSAILMNMKSRSVLYVQNEDSRIPPASLTKIMTMYVAMDLIEEGKISLTDEVKISKRAAGQPGSRMNLKEGDLVTLDELLSGAAVASGNDAAVAVAEHAAGSVESFVKLMNVKAGELGMSRTVFKNPNGLPASGHVTSARDMLTLAASYIDTYPDALRYHGVREITYKNTTTTNKNPLLRMYSFVDGLKTGYTNASKHNLIATAKSGDVRLVSVVLGAPTSGDLTYESAFLIESGFRTVSSGGVRKVVHQLSERSGDWRALIASPGSAVVTEDPGEDAGDEPVWQESAGPDSADLGWYAGWSPEELPDWTPESRPDERREAGAVREIDAYRVAEEVAKLCIESNYIISGDIREAIRTARDAETNETSRDVLGQLLENADIAGEGDVPLCQDTGMTVVFVEIGQDVRIVGGSLREAIDQGVSMGYSEGYLRASVVADPIDRVNTWDNTPAVIHFDIVPGDKLKITVAPKGFGSENMSRLAMLTPSQGIAGVKEFVVDAVRRAGPNPCPPIIVGVGVGGTMEYAALLAKRALLRPVGTRNDNWLWRGLEEELLDAINALDIGPAGLGGKTTALAVHIETYPTHIAGLPVAVNIGCHATRHAEVTF
jgi:fumarate hydratase subunit alpha